MGKTSVILKQKVDKLGEPGDLVTVSSGYVRNFLLPKNLCVLSGKEELAALDVRKEQIRKKAQQELDHISGLSRNLSELTIKVPVKVGKTGKIFGSVTAMHISEILHTHNISVEKKNIHIETPIKELGPHTVTINLGHGQHAKLAVEVVSE